jgi:basic membrane protein A
MMRNKILAAAALASSLLSGVAMAQERTFVFVAPDRIGTNKALAAMQSAVEQTAAAQSASARTFEGTDPATRRDSVQAAIDLGAEVVVVFGFEFGDIIADLGPANPDTKFAVVDTCVAEPTPNVYCGTFRQQEVSYLVGAEAALTSKTGVVAAVGALDIPYLHRYTDSFELGAKAARADITVLPPLWVGGNNPFQDPLRANTQAQQQIAQNADRIYALTAGGNGGIFQAAAKAGVLAIGFDVNQCPEAPGAVLDSALLKFDVVVPELVSRALANSAENVVDFGLEMNGLGLVGMDSAAVDSQCEIVNFPPQVIETLGDFRAKIASGEIVVPDPLNP